MDTDKDIVLITTEDELFALRAAWLSWTGVAAAFGVKKAQAHKIMAKLPAEDVQTVSIRIPDYDPRPFKVARAAAISQFVRRKRGNPKWHDTGFQQEMAFRRWHGKQQNTQNRPETPLERGYLVDDEVRLIYI